MPSKVWIRTLVATAVVIACGVGTAHATVIDQGHFSGQDTAVPDNLCGIDVVRDSVFRGSFRIRVPKSGGGEAFLQRFNLKSTDTFTNPLNGKSLTFEANELNNELSATRIDGNVYEFDTIEAGQAFVLRDGAGRIVYRDRGNIRRIVTFDTLGDGQPGGIQLDETVVRISGPHPAFETTDDEFCAVVESLIG